MGIFGPSRRSAESAANAAAIRADGGELAADLGFGPEVTEPVRSVMDVPEHELWRVLNGIPKIDVSGEQGERQ